MEILAGNIKYRFTEPKHTFEKKNNYCKVYVNYYFGGKRCFLKYSDGLNTSYFTVTDDLSKIEIRKRAEERLKIVIEIKDQFIKYIKNRQFDPISKSFDLPSDAKPLLDYYDDYIQVKKIEQKADKTIKVYESKVKMFKDYLVKLNIPDILVNSEKLFQVYEDYFLEQKAKGRRNSTNNDILNFHRFVFNYIINTKRVDVKHPMKGNVKAQEKQYVDKHKAIQSHNILESFKQLSTYGSEILSLFSQFIFYTLHRGDTLCKLQLHDFDFDNNLINIPPNKIKTKRRTFVKLHPYLKKLVVDYITDNNVDQDYYLFGSDSSNTKKVKNNEYRLFGKCQAKRESYTDKFAQFINKQLPKAHLENPHVKKIFIKSYNTLYGYKHTGAVFLKQNGWNLEQIIQMTGHQDEEIIKIYLRDFTPVLPPFPVL